MKKKSCFEFCYCVHGVKWLLTKCTKKALKPTEKEKSTLIAAITKISTDPNIFL